MTLSLSLDTLLQAVTDIAAGIQGIRHAYNYDEWPDAPNGMFNRDQAMHLTGFPEEGSGWSYRRLGTGLNEIELVVPMYTLVLKAAQIRRARSWVAPYFDRYPDAFNAHMLLNGAITSGSALYTGGTVVRSIPDFPGYDDFYMLRHTLEIHTKGAITQTA